MPWPLLSLLCRRQYGDAWHLLAYPWQPERAQIVADEFCREQGYLQAGTARPFSLPAAMVTLADNFLVYERAGNESGLEQPRICTGMACTAYAVIECVPHGGEPCVPDSAQNIGNGNTGIGNVGHYNDGSHNLGSRNVGSRNIGDFNLCALCIGHRLQGFSLAGPPAILPNGTDTNLKLEPTKEEL
jgi:hypothetical protein